VTEEALYVETVMMGADKSGRWQGIRIEKWHGRLISYRVKEIRWVSVIV